MTPCHLIVNCRLFAEGMRSRGRGEKRTWFFLKLKPVSWKRGMNRQWDRKRGTHNAEWWTRVKRAGGFDHSLLSFFNHGKRRIGRAKRAGGKENKKYNERVRCRTLNESLKDKSTGSVWHLSPSPISLSFSLNLSQGALNAFWNYKWNGGKKREVVVLILQFYNGTLANYYSIKVPSYRF